MSLNSWGSILGPTHFSDPGDVISNFVVYADVSVLGLLICGNDLSKFLDLNLTCYTVCSGEWIDLVIPVLWKLRLLNLVVRITLVLLMWKWMGQFLMKIHILRYWECISLLNWIGVFSLSMLLKLRWRKFEALFVMPSFFFLRLYLISVNLTSCYSWNTVFMSGPLNLLLHINPWLTVEM